MKKIILGLLFALGFSTLAMATATPTGLSVGVLSSSNSASLYWTNDPTVYQWNIYVNGTLQYSPYVSDTSLTNTTTRMYGMLNLPKTGQVAITMQALAAGQPWSLISAAVTITTNTTGVLYVVNAPGTTLSTSGGYVGPALGQALSVSSSPVVLASDQSAVHVFGFTGLTTSVSGPYPFSLTYTASGAITGVTVVAAVSGKTIVVTDWYLSTSAASEMVLHHQITAFYSSTPTSNIIDDEFFPANAGAERGSGLAPGLGQNQGVYLDVTAAGNYRVGGHYITQ